MASVSSPPAAPKGNVIDPIVVRYLLTCCLSPERHLKASRVALRKPQTGALSNAYYLFFLSNTPLA